MDRYANPRGSATRRATAGEGGYVLLAVTVFVFVLIIAGLAMFSTASYETRLAIHDQESTQAFYLADAALERAKARLLDDRTWRAGWSGVALGGGTYDLAIADTVIGGSSDPYVRLIATGTFQNARRRIMAVGELPPSAFELSLLASGDLTANATTCIDGRVHVSGDAYFGNHGQHLHCGELTEGFAVQPPQIYTDPAHLTGSTYYEVRGIQVGGVPQARVYDRNGNDVTASTSDLHLVTTYNAGTGRYTFSFGSATLMGQYFNQTNGVFQRAAGDASVIVNFGEAPLGATPGPNGVANVVIRGSGSTTLNTTIVNTRFTGITNEQRIDAAYWTGGTTSVERLTIEPLNGFSMICHELVTANSTNIGTSAHPGLLYITGGASVTGSSFDFYGSLICMGSLSLGARSDFTYDPSFLELLPDYLEQEWLSMVSGTLRTVYWRELAPPPVGS
jgi:hypothetical protein